MDIKNELEKLIPNERFKNLGERAKKAEEEKKKKKENQKRKAAYQTNYRKKQLERTIKLPSDLLLLLSTHYKLKKSETLRALLGDFLAAHPDEQSEFILNNIKKKAPNTANNLTKFNFTVNKELNKGLNKICTKHKVYLQDLTSALLDYKYTRIIHRIAISPQQRLFRNAALAPNLWMKPTISATLHPGLWKSSLQSAALSRGLWDKAPHSAAFGYRTLEENPDYTVNPNRFDPIPPQQQAVAAVENNLKTLNQDQNQRHSTPDRTSVEQLSSDEQPKTAVSSNIQPSTAVWPNASVQPSLLADDQWRVVAR
ncbi:MAG: hypothetical protein RBR45_13680 [Pseudomonas sp.]|nr:hypothetical protein [Pseudomonas sp.]